MNSSINKERKNEFALVRDSLSRDSKRQLDDIWAKITRTIMGSSTATGGMNRRRHFLDGSGMANTIEWYADPQHPHKAWWNIVLYYDRQKFQATTSYGSTGSDSVPKTNRLRMVYFKDNDPYKELVPHINEMLENFNRIKGRSGVS